MAIGAKDRRPAAGTPSLRIARLSKLALGFGVETHDVEGVPVRVFSAAKTVADYFKYRNKIGLNVALKLCGKAAEHSSRSHTLNRLGGKRAKTSQIWEAATVCRVANVIRPYIEVLI